MLKEGSRRILKNSWTVKENGAVEANSHMQSAHHLLDWLGGVKGGRDLPYSIASSHIHATTGHNADQAESSTLSIKISVCVCVFSGS